MKDFNGELYTYLQRAEIEQGKTDQLSKEEMALFTDRSFNYLQMGVIRSALHSGMAMEQVSKVARPYISAADMEELIEAIKKGEDPPIPKPRGKLPVSIMAALLVILLGIALFVLVYPGNSSLSLRLTADEIRLATGMEFDPMAYVKEYHGEHANLILPEPFRAEIPETRLVVYQLENEEETIKKVLRIKIVDETPPDITLSSESIELLKVTPFACRTYLIKAQDNVDGDLSDEVECSDQLSDEETQTVIYSVRDSSGNQAVRELTVHYADYETETAEPSEPSNPTVTLRVTPEPAVIPPTQAPYTAPVQNEIYGESVITEYSETVEESQEIVSSETIVEHSFS